MENVVHDSVANCSSLHAQAIMQAAQLKADGKAQRVIVTGCLAQRYSQDLAGNTRTAYAIISMAMAQASNRTQVGRHSHRMCSVWLQ